MNNPRTDCFSWSHVHQKCNCLRETCADCNNCSFYKSSIAHKQELLLYNGTTSLNEALIEYAKDHGC